LSGGVSYSRGSGKKKKKKKKKKRRANSDTSEIDSVTSALTTPISKSSNSKSATANLQ